MNGGAESGDGFGWSLASGDFDDDGFDDLAIGVPGEDDSEGQVQVVFGSATGLRPSGNLFWSETFIGGLSEDGDRFGETLAAGDFDGDGFDDLVVGIPWENLGAAANAGQVDVLYGAFDGFNRMRTQFWAEDAIFGGGTSESNDAFGYALASGDFDKDGFADLAIGHPAESVGGAQDGAVTVLMGSAAGLTAARRATDRRRGRGVRRRPRAARRVLRFRARERRLRRRRPRRPRRRRAVGERIRRQRRRRRGGALRRPLRRRRGERRHDAVVADRLLALHHVQQPQRRRRREARAGGQQVRHSAEPVQPHADETGHLHLRPRRPRGRLRRRAHTPRRLLHRPAETSP